jgi:hypothetical protein
VIDGSDGIQVSMRHLMLLYSWDRNLLLSAILSKHDLPFSRRFERLITVVERLERSERCWAAGSPAKVV